MYNKIDEYYKNNTIIQKKLEDLFQYLKESNDFFSKLILLSNSINIFDMWKKIPIITKEDIKNNFSMYISKDGTKFTTEMTSGTTGQPIQCLKSTHERNIKSIEIWRLRKEIDPQVNVMNFVDLLGKFAGGNYNVLDVSEDNITKILLYLQKIAPRWLCASPSLILQYAKFIAKYRKTFETFSVKYIELQGEILDQKNRKFIEEIFNAKVVMNYGNRECWNIAYECKAGQLHINDLFLVETVKKHIIVTDLVNRVMPIVRYDTGDTGKIKYLETCSCGKKHCVVLELIGARKSQQILGHGGKSGDLVFKRIIHKVLREYNKNTDIIEAYRVVQKDINFFDFYIVPGNGFNEIIKQKIITFSQEELSNKSKINIKLVQTIPLGKNAKKSLFIVDKQNEFKGEIK